MKRRIALKTLLAGTLLGLGLAAQPLPAAADGENVVLFLKNITNPYWRSVRIGGEKAAKQQNLKFEIAAPTKPDNIEEQTRLVEDWIVKKPDAFVFVPVDYKAMVPAVQVMENLMQRFPQIDGVMAANDDMAVGIVEALEAAGRGGQTKVVGVDAIPDAAQLIKQGKMFASADYSGHDQGYLATTAAAKHLRGEAVPEEIILPVTIVTQENVDPWLLPPEEKPVPDWNKVVAAQK